MYVTENNTNVKTIDLEDYEVLALLANATRARLIPNVIIIDPANDVIEVTLDANNRARIVVTNQSQANGTGS